jgi:YVTN family beta-propeller protein
MTRPFAFRRHVAALGVLLALGCEGGAPAGPQPETGTTHPAGTIASTLTLPGRPHGVAIASTGRFCVSLIDGGSVSCGMLSAGPTTMGASTQVGLAPAHVALSADGSRAYTANQYGNSLSIVDVTTSALLATVPLTSGGFNVLADPSSSRVYVTTSSGELHVVDADARSVVARVQLGAASNGLALDRTAGLLYVSSISAGTVSVVSTASNTVIKTHTVSPMPQRIALSPDGKSLFVATESTGLEILNVTTGARVTVTGVSTGAVGLALSPDGKVVYVTNPPRGELQIVDVASRNVTTLSGLASPRNVAFGLSGAAALVTGEGNVVYTIR